jgi:uncharacterized tellurite resistance protein B-like protein
MVNFFRKNNQQIDKFDIVSLTSLLIHAAKIDENYSDNEKKIIKNTLLKLEADSDEIDKIIEKAEEIEKNSNQILEFTKEAKNLDIDKKILILEALWEIVYSDSNADIYETNLIRRNKE